MKCLSKYMKKKLSKIIPKLFFYLMGEIGARVMTSLNCLGEAKKVCEFEIEYIF